MADIFETSSNEVIDGTALDDTIFSGPTNDPDAIDTGGDTIRAGGGNDTVLGQAGITRYMAGQRRFFGELGTGDDTLLSRETQRRPSQITDSSECDPILEDP